jgi:hypothetical protein
LEIPDLRLLVIRVDPHYRTPAFAADVGWTVSFPTGSDRGETIIKAGSRVEAWLA